MLAPSNLTVILLAVFVLHVIAFQLGGSKFSFAIPNETNASSLIDESTHSLTAVNIDTSLSGNLTRQLKWIASKEQENYYDFVAVGDWGCTSNTNKTVQGIMEKNPNLVVALGDYSYEATPNCWIKKIAPIHGLMKIAIGNHDDPAQEYLRYFGLSSQYYSYNYGNVHFIVISTEVPFEKSSSQYNFVKGDLQNASGNPDIKWIIVANHRTTYPGGLKDHEVNYLEDNRISSKFRDTYHPLFDQYKVDLVLQGHTHNYQRTYPLQYNIENPDVPKITDIHKNHYLDPNGVLFLTVGTGGVRLLNSFGSYNAYENNTYGFLYLRVQKDGSLLEGTFYNQNSVNGPIAQDTFSIKKTIPFSGTPPSQSMGK